MSNPVFLSRVNMSATAAQCFLGDAFVASVKRINGNWKALSAAGTVLLETPHDAVQAFKNGKNIVRREAPVPLGVFLGMLREHLLPTPVVLAEAA